MEWFLRLCGGGGWWSTRQLMQQNYKNWSQWAFRSCWKCLNFSWSALELKVYTHTHTLSLGLMLLLAASKLPLCTIDTPLLCSDTRPQCCFNPGPALQTLGISPFCKFFHKCHPSGFWTTTKPQPCIIAMMTHTHTCVHTHKYRT